jgi:hypothetical protein
MPGHPCAQIVIDAAGSIEENPDSRRPLRAGELYEQDLHLGLERREARLDELLNGRGVVGSVVLSRLFRHLQKQEWAEAHSS